MKRSLRLVLAALVAVAVSLALPSRADAAPPTAAPADDAFARFKREGDEAMISLRYDAALDAYQKAYDARHEPAILYNLGRAHEALGHFPEALDNLLAFQRVATPEQLARIGSLDALIDSVRRRVSTLVISSNVVGARVLVRSQLVGTTPFSQPVRLASGHAAIVVEAEGYEPLRQEVELPGAGQLVIDAKLSPRDVSSLLRVTSAPGARVLVDGRAVGDAPTEVRLPPGKHALVVRHADAPEVATSVVLGEREQRLVDVPLAVDKPLVKRWWFWTGVGVLAAGGAVALGVALTTQRAVPSGSIPPGRISTGFRF
jgi:hypothetical protein